MRRNLIYTITLLLLLFLFVGCNEGFSDDLPKTFKISAETFEVEEGQSISLKVEGFEDKNIVWSSSDEMVATVNAGEVNGLFFGKANITARYGSYGDTVEVEVYEKGRAKDVNLDSKITNIIDKMSIEKKIGQLFLVGIEGTTLSESEIENIKNYHFGNIYLSKNNIESGNQLALLNTNIQKELYKQNGIYGFIGTTKTLGDRNELSPLNDAYLPYNKIIGNSTSLNDSRTAGRLIGAELVNFGINLDFVYSLNAETGMAGRGETAVSNDAFSSNYEKNASCAKEFIKGVNERGVLAVGGLFPVYNEAERQISSGDKYFNVYRETMKEDLDGIIVNDIIYSLADTSHSCIISYPVVTGILYDKLKFDGLVFTPDMNNFSGGYNASDELYSRPAILALSAGINMFYFSSQSNTCIAYFNDLINAYNEDLIDDETIDNAVYRVLEKKYEYGLIEDFSIRDIKDSYDYTGMNSFIESMEINKIIQYSDIDFEPIGKDEKVYIFAPSYDFASGEESLGEALKNYLISKGYNEDLIDYYIADNVSTIRNLYRRQRDIDKAIAADRVIIIASIYQSARSSDNRNLAQTLDGYTNINYVGIGSSIGADYFNETYPTLVLLGNGERDYYSLFKYMIGNLK